MSTGAAGTVAAAAVAAGAAGPINAACENYGRTRQDLVLSRLTQKRLCGACWKWAQEHGGRMRPIAGQPPSSPATTPLMPAGAEQQQQAQDGGPEEEEGEEEEDAGSEAAFRKTTVAAFNAAVSAPAVPAA